LSSNNFTGFETGSNCTFQNLDMFMASHLPAFNCSLYTLFSYIKGSNNSIMQIDISHSKVYGHLPGFVFSFYHLTSLKLASNNLTGVIPDPFHTMPYLTLLDLQDNDFSGPIPKTFSRLLMLAELNVRGNKKLNGNVVPKFFHLDYTMGIKEQKSTTCPMLRFDHNNGKIYVDPSYYNKTYCYCNEHFFGNGKLCIKCMLGGSCPGSKTKDLQSKAAKLRTFDDAEPEEAPMIMKPGFFPFPNGSDVKSMHKCPSSGAYVKICVPQHNKCGCYVNTTERIISTQKLTTLHGTKIICNKSCLCLLGHSGRFCSQCIEGYYKEGIHCYKCIVGPRRSAALGILFSATIGSILVAAAILCISTKKLKTSVFLTIAEVMVLFGLVWKHLLPVVIPQIVIVIFILGFSSHLQRCTALLKTAMFYFQVMDSFVSTTAIWPKAVHSMQVYISSSLNLSFSSLTCTLPHFFTLFVKNLMLFFLPVACIGILWLTFILCNLCTKRTKEKRLELNYKCRKYSLVIVDVAYFPIVRSCFSIIVGCRTIEGVSFMKSYPRIDCNSSEYSSLTVIAILELILYVIAIPFVIYLPLLVFYRNYLSDDNSPICNWLSPLITPYKPEYRAFIEVFMLLRRLIIAVLMTSFPASSSLQALFVTMLLLIAIIFEAKARPFKNPTKMKCGDESHHDGLGLENGIDIFMLSCVLLSFVCVGLSTGHGHLVPSALFVVMIPTNGIFVFAFCCSIFYRLLQGGSNADDYGKLPELSESIPNVNEDCDLRESSDP